MKKNIVFTVWPFVNRPEFCQDYGIVHKGSDEFVEQILNDSGQSHFVFVAPEEFVLSGEKNLHLCDLDQQLLAQTQTVKDKQIDISVITGRYHKQPHGALAAREFISVMEPHINIYHWYTYWMFSSVRQYVKSRVDIMKHYPEVNVTRAFTCVNGKPHPHRCYFMDLLAKHDLIDSNIVSWVSPTYMDHDWKYAWQYWNEQYLVHEQFNDIDGTPHYPDTDPAEYYHSLVDIITETSSTVVFWTEKTVKPLALQRPFVIVGAQYANLWLKDLGFELFEEFIDYEFDYLTNYADRANHIVAQLCKLNQRSDYDQIRRSLAAKLKHNQQRLLEIALDPTQIPLREILSKHIEKYDMIMCENQQMIAELNIQQPVAKGR